jgi:hypothetical protein
MSDFGNKLNIGMNNLSTLFNSCVCLVTENIPHSVKNFEYKTKEIFDYSTVSEYMREFYVTHEDFISLIHRFLYVVLFIELVWTRTALSAYILEEKKKLKKQQDIICSLYDSKDEIISNKLDSIEEIMISGDYNDPDYLKYDKNWTMDLLMEKATQMEIPDIKWGSKTALGFVIRTVEQLIKIGDIVKPVYPDGYETEEMVDEDYTTDED